jgi:hypothetical protein
MENIMLTQLPETKLNEHEYNAGLENAVAVYQYTAKHKFRNMLNYYNEKAGYIDQYTNSEIVSYWKGYHDFLQQRILAAQKNFVCMNIESLGMKVLKLMSSGWKIVNQEENGLTVKTRFYKKNRVAIVDWQKSSFLVMKQV